MSSATQQTYDRNTGFKPRPGQTPNPVSVQAWRERAGAMMEDCLARYDADLVAGLVPADAARAAIADFVAWTRITGADFVILDRAGAHHASLRTQERSAWERLAESAARDAELDPGSVDRFLKVWFGVVYEAVCTGHGALYLSPIR